MTIEELVLSEIRAGRTSAKAVAESRPVLMLADIKRVIRKLERRGKILRAGFGKQTLRVAE